jgi:hypothetical protein
MPLPSPNTGETQDDFMARCMGNDAVTTEYPDQDQRTAICLRQFVGEATDGKADDGEMIVKAIGPLDQGRSQGSTSRPSWEPSAKWTDRATSFCRVVWGTG